MYLAYDSDGWRGCCSVEHFDFVLWSLVLVLFSEGRNWSFV